MNSKRDPPEMIGRHFYSIHTNEDGTADIYLWPDGFPKETKEKNVACNITALVLKNMPLFDGLEEDIRARYDAYCKSAEVICL